MSTQLHVGDPPSTPLRRPAAVLHLWRAAPVEEPPAGLDRLIADLIAPGIVLLGSGRLAVTPIAGDPAPFDTAVALARRLLAAAADTVSGLCLLIAPAELVIEGTEVTLQEEKLLVDFATRPPDLPPGVVHLTSWAVKMLEDRPLVSLAQSYSGPSGSYVPIFAAGDSDPDRRPWRNPELLGRRPPWQPRVTLAAALQDALELPAFRVRGPIGTGKSRLVWEAVSNLPEETIWVHAQPPRRRGPSLAEQIASRLASPVSGATEIGGVVYQGTGPDPSSAALRLLGDRVLAALAQDIEESRLRRIICDDLEQAGERDLELLARLVDSPGLGQTFTLILVSRPMAWPETLRRLPVVEVSRLSPPEMAAAAERLTAGLATPVALTDRFLAACGGLPFAFEEGWVELIRDKDVRRVYGSFFYGGEPGTDYRPSMRLVCHMEAESQRLGYPTPMRLLSLVDVPLPAPEVAATASILGVETGKGWDGTALAAGLAASGEGPWGAGIAVTAEALAAALRDTLPRETQIALGQTLGEVLVSRGRAGEALWISYRLLAGSPAAIPALLRALAAGPRAPREEYLASLTAELAAHRQRQGQPEIELELLWHLLPLARRLGRLQEFTRDLDRALELAVAEPRRLLALAGIKAELDRRGGRYQEAERTIQQALKNARDRDQRRQALLLIQLGRLYLEQRRYAEARKLFISLHRALSGAGLAALAASCRFYLGNIALHEHRFGDATRFHQEALAERRRQGLLGPTGLSLSALGTIKLRLGDYPEALALYRKAHRLLEEHGKAEDVSYTLLGEGRTLSRLGDYTGALALFREALEIRTGRDDSAGESIARLDIADCLSCLGHTEVALEEARQAHFTLSLLSLRGPTAEADQLLSRLHFRQQRYADAREHLDLALEAHRELDQISSAAVDEAWLIDVAIALEDEAAVRHHAAALKGLLARLDRPEAGERLGLRMFRGLEWLSERGHPAADPMPYLESAYKELLAKASRFEPDLRHRFLFQVADHQAILEAATRHQLAHHQEVGLGT